MRRILSLLLIAIAGGCGSCVEPIPVVPVDPGPVVPPPPQPPEPPMPIPAGHGEVDESAFRDVPDGSLEADVVSRLGAPFSSHDAAGFHVATYVFNGTSRSGFFWYVNGRMDHRSVTP